MPNMKKVDPFIKWAGGKRWLIRNYSELLPREFNRYYEPFLGSGAVFFHLLPAKATLSDVNIDLIETYKSIRDDWKIVYDLLVEHDEKHSKDYYYEIRNSESSDRFIRSAQFIYLNRTCFNGIYRVSKSGKFNVPIGSRNSVLHNTDNFEIISEVLKNASFYTDDFKRTIGKSKEGDLLFADPPYTVSHNKNGFIQYNEKIFAWEDQVKLASSLKAAKLRGVKIVMTNANHQAVRDLYSTDGFEIIHVSRFSSISADPGKRKKYDEIVIRANI